MRTDAIPDLLLNDAPSPTSLLGFSRPLLLWYDTHKRDLPWRRRPDAYAIWISEIMLQQTRVAAVIGYYERFLTRFPELRSLALAEESEVLTYWSGLGYYRRARMMHRAAQSVVAEHAGEFPRAAEALQRLPGIGRYTAAAIASIAFQQPIGVVDGNVERVLSRLTGTLLNKEQCWGLVPSLMAPSEDRPGDFNQAMMELGATLCTPKSPQCLLCPVSEMCRTRGEHETAPRSPRRTALLQYLLRIRQSSVLLRLRPASERLMPSMWELPSIGATNADPSYRLRHSITDTDYRVLVFTRGRRSPKDGSKWLPISSLAQLPLTGISRKIFVKAHILKPERSS